MLILGIESSCDETAVALVRNGREVLSSLVASQTAVHARFGGVVPEVASREHLKIIDPLVRATLREAGASFEDVEAIAVTQGPGLIGALLVGVAYAKGLAAALGKPLVPVDHVHAHIHGALLGVLEDSTAGRSDADIYPTLALVVSGGHTNLYLMESPTSFKIIANSVDDACGECFDKSAKLLGLPYPGGPVIEKLARQGQAGNVPMPRMVERKSQLEFSYSGLKTYMANLLNKEPKPLPEQRLADICAAFQEEALGQLVRKLKEGFGRHPHAKSVLIAGGVAANVRFRQLMQEHLSVPVIFPQLQFCSDNGAMIAAYGYHLYREGLKQGQTFSKHVWDAYSRYQYANVIS